jgi:hypothetical protein
MLAVLSGDKQCRGMVAWSADLAQLAVGLGESSPSRAERITLQ